MKIIRFLLPLVVGALLIAGGIVLQVFTSTEGDANIGAGIVFLAGIIVMLVGLGFLSVALRTTWLRVLAGVAAIVIIIVNILLVIMSDTESNRIYCEEKAAQGLSVYEDKAFCRKYLNDEQLKRIPE